MYKTEEQAMKKSNYYLIMKHFVGSRVSAFELYYY